METTDVEFLSDKEGKPVAVVIPIEMWRDMESELETAYLLKSPAMKERLLKSMQSEGGITLEEVRAKLGI